MIVGGGVGTGMSSTRLMNIQRTNERKTAGDPVVESLPRVFRNNPRSPVQRYDTCDDTGRPGLGPPCRTGRRRY